jgi:hypothetical protein
MDSTVILFTSVALAHGSQPRRRHKSPIHLLVGDDGVDVAGLHLVRIEPEARVCAPRAILVQNLVHARPVTHKTGRGEGKGQGDRQRNTKREGERGGAQVSSISIVDPIGACSVPSRAT